jgi:hypothetical protein
MEWIDAFRPGLGHMIHAVGNTLLTISGVVIVILLAWPNRELLSGADQAPAPGS